MAGEESTKCSKDPWPNRIEKSPPFFGDIGKQARSIFSKGFNLNSVKFDFLSITKNGIEFITNGLKDNEGGEVKANLVSKYKFKDYGVSFIEKWNTDNLISTEIAVTDFCEGVKLGLDSSFSPESGDKSCKLVADYKNKFVALNLGLDFKENGPKIIGAAVIGYEGYILGYQTEYELESEQTPHGAILGYIGEKYIVASSYEIKENRVLSGSIFNKVSKKIDAALQFSYNADDGDIEYGFGCSYNLCEGASLGFKINNQALIGLRLTEKINDFVAVALSCEIDPSKLNQGGHKTGFGLEVNL